MRSRFAARSRAVEEAWRRCLDLTGRPPTLRELCDATGLKSVASAHRYKSVLVAEGRIADASLRQTLLRLHNENRCLAHEVEMLRLRLGVSDG